MPILVTAILTGIGLSMDAFSLAIVYGTLSFEKKKIITLSVIVACYHFFMPLIGYMLGEHFLSRFIMNPKILVGTILGVIAIQMLISLYKDEEIIDLKNFMSLLLFGFTVSIDSFSVGLGLGTMEESIILPAMIFSIISGSFTYVGLCLGNQLNKKLGRISTIIGSILLILLALHHLL